jgi:hypothetical protein
VDSLSNCDDVPTVEEAMTKPIDGFNSPLQLLVGPNYGAPDRGAVIGNLLLWLCVAAVLFLVTIALQVQAKRRDDVHESLIDSAARLRLPGSFVAVLFPFLQQLMTSSVRLVGYGGHTWEALASDAWSKGDPILGVLALAVIMVSYGALVRILRPGDAFRAETVTHPEVVTGTPMKYLMASPRLLLRWLVTPAYEWRPRNEVTDSLFVQRYGFVFESMRCGRHWYVLICLGTTLLLGILSGIVPSSAAMCGDIAWTIVVLCAVSPVASVLLRPTNSRLDQVLLTLVGTSQLLVALSERLRAPEELIATIVLVTSIVSSVLMLISVVVMVRDAHRRVKSSNSSSPFWELFVAKTLRKTQMTAHAAADRTLCSAGPFMPPPSLAHLISMACRSRGRSASVDVSSRVRFAASR